MLTWGYPEEQRTPGPIDRSETRLLMFCYFILTISCYLISYYEIFKHLYHNTGKNRSFSAFAAKFDLGEFWKKFKTIDKVGNCCEKSSKGGPKAQKLLVSEI